MTTFSVILPTRNRAALFRTALDSVLSQTGAEFEVIVVNDGTSGQEADALDRIKATYAGAATFIDLPVTRGHGCFRVMNTGASYARGDYLCFLDDDDCWTDPGHLAQAQRIVQQNRPVMDAIFFDQAAYRGQTNATGPIWLEDLGDRLAAEDDAGRDGGYAVHPDELLTAHGFAHTNTTVVRRDTFNTIGGFDTGLRYEGDRDFFLRLIDRAANLRYAPTICARHNIPSGGSLSTTTSDFDKALDQVRLLHKAVHHAKHAGIRAYALRHRRYALQRALRAVGEAPRLVGRLARFLPTLVTKPVDNTTVASLPITDDMVQVGRRLGDRPMAAAAQLSP